MTKVNRKDATRELLADATKVKEEASRARKGADNLLQSLKALENGFVKANADKEAEIKRAEAEKQRSDHSKAYVMLDAEDRAAIEAAEKEAARVKAEKAAAEKAAAEKAAAEKAAAEKAKEEAAKKPTIGQIISRPGQNVPSKPVGLAPNVIRPPRPQQPRPAQPAQGQQGQQQGRPANGNFQPRPQQAGQGNIQPRPQGQGNFQPRPQGQGNFQPRPQGAPGQGRPMGGGMSRPKPAAPDMAPAMGKERVSNYDPNKKNYVRQHDPEHVARNRKQLSRDAGYSGYDDDVIRGGKKSRQ